jgi:hypothetical protein
MAVDAKSAELDSLRPALRTLEDSLVLDLLLGYRQLLVQAENTSSLDRETLRRARGAYNQLEYLLRKGGIKERGREARAYTLPGGEKLTLRELVEQLSRALLKSGADGDWKGAADRAREIQRHRPDLTSLVEDAGWCLALAEALEGPLNPDLKKRLRFLHDSYALEVPHDDIVKQVNGLLSAVEDDRLRREMKKLANRSWERDKRRGRFKEPAAAVRPDTVKAPGAEAGPSLPPPVPAPPGESGMPGLPVDPAAAQEEKNRVDTLALRGEYLAAARILETLEGRAESGWIQDARKRLGSRYCEERRTAAAASFSAARKAQNDAARVGSLRQSLQALDSCLFHFPDSPVSAKVRRNREIVEKELKR